MALDLLRHRADDQAGARSDAVAAAACVWFTTFGTVTGPVVASHRVNCVSVVPWPVTATDSVCGLQSVMDDTKLSRYTIVEPAGNRRVCVGDVGLGGSGDVVSASAGRKGIHDVVSSRSGRTYADCEQRNAEATRLVGHEVLGIDGRVVAAVTNDDHRSRPGWSVTPAGGEMKCSSATLMPSYTFVEVPGYGSIVALTSVFLPAASVIVNG